MSQETGPPVLIPEGGLTISPAVWQTVFVLGAPIIAFIAIAVPVIFIGAIVSTALLWFLNTIKPPKYPPVLMHQPQLDQSTPQLYNNENT